MIFSIVASPVVPLEKDSAKGKQVWAPCEWMPDQHGRCHVLAAGRKGAAIVLSHSCELDKPKSKGRVLVAPIPSLASLPDDQRAGVLAQQKRAAVPLPGVPTLGDCYADLNSVLTVDRRILDDCTRLASMSEDGRRRVKLQLIEFFARVDASSLGISGV